MHLDRGLGYLSNYVLQTNTQDPLSALQTLHEWHMKQRLLPTFIGKALFRSD